MSNNSSTSNLSICYNVSLPGIVGVSDNVVANKSESIFYTDPNGDINIRISGPYQVSEPDIVESKNFNVFISKENAREKYTICAVTGPGKSNIKVSNPVDLNTAVIYSELDPDDISIEYFYLKIRYTDLSLARGTYVIRIFDGNKELKQFTLTVKSNPIQGDAINKQYIETANRWIE